MKTKERNSDGTTGGVKGEADGGGCKTRRGGSRGRGQREYGWAGEGGGLSEAGGEDGREMALNVSGGSSQAQGKARGQCAGDRPAAGSLAAAVAGHGRPVAVAEGRQSPPSAAGSVLLRARDKRRRAKPRVLDSRAATHQRFGKQRCGGPMPSRDRRSHLSRRAPGCIESTCLARSPAIMR